MIFLFSAVYSQTINVKDYIKDKFPSIFGFYLSSLEDLDSYEKEFIDLLQKLPKEEQENYAKEVYKNGFSLELLKNVKEGKTIQAPTSKPALPSLPEQKEESTENLPTLIKRIAPSTVIVFTYDDKGEFLQLGSGFFISQSGDIITNYHVLQRASSAEIKTSDGKTYPITYIVAEDEQNDIIRLSVDIPSKYVRPLSLSKTIPEVGERIIVYGSPLGLEKTVSDGIVSAIREVPAYGKVIQITAPVSLGSSGSPVLNMNGEVIGIATFQMIEGQNLNFAIPSEKIKNLEIGVPKYDWGNIKEKMEKNDGILKKATYYLFQKDYKNALPYFKEIAKKGSNDFRIYFAIGYCNHRLGFFEEAIEAYKKAIIINPSFVEAYINLGCVYGVLEFYDEQLKVCKEAIQIDPNNAEAYLFLGNAYSSLSYLDANFFILLDEAIKAYKQAIWIDPDYPEAHFMLGASYSILGDMHSAINEYKILKVLDIDLANKLFDLIY